MRFRVQGAWLLLAIAAVSRGPKFARAQAATASNDAARPELALGYSYVRSNAPPGGCTCFNQNGGSAEFAWPLGSGQFAVVGDVTATYASGIAGYSVTETPTTTGIANGAHNLTTRSYATTTSVATSSYGLTMSTYTGGIRYVPPIHSALKPFGQVLVGFGHASGTLVSGPGTNVGNAGAAFASILGGGVDWRLNGRWSIRLAEADYLLTMFDNGSNNHQNNLRISTGVVVRF
jgi:outer membrane immunogenic protein